MKDAICKSVFCAQLQLLPGKTLNYQRFQGFRRNFGGVILESTFPICPCALQDIQSAKLYARLLFPRVDPFALEL